MTQKSTLLLKAALILMSLAALAFCVALPFMVSLGRPTEGPLSPLKIPVLLGVYGCAVPFFIALYQSFLLLRSIDAGTAFSEASVVSLKAIQRCAVVVFAILLVAGLPFFYYVSQLTDAPGFMLIGLVLTFAAFIIAVFASLLQRLLRDAIAAKTENDLTV